MDVLTLLVLLLKHLYKQDWKPAFTSASIWWLHWFHTKLSPHILQQNCAYACTGL